MLTGAYPEGAFGPVAVGPTGAALPVFARRNNLCRNEDYKDVRNKETTMSLWVQGSSSSRSLHVLETPSLRRKSIKAGFQIHGS